MSKSRSPAPKEQVVARLPAPSANGEDNKAATPSLQTSTNTEWETHLTAARAELEKGLANIAWLKQQSEQAVNLVMTWAEAEGVEVHEPGLRALLEKPYFLEPTSDPNEWRVTLLRVRKDAPIVGWVEYQDEVRIVSRISRLLRFVTEIPGWMLKKLGWKPPEFSAVLDPVKGVVDVTDGDPSAFRKKYARFLQGGAEGHFRIRKEKAWIDLLDQMLNDGILPYQPNPVKPEHWKADIPSLGFDLRTYQQQAVDQFIRDGAMSLILPSGAGKTFAALHLLGHLVGHQTILCDSSVLVEQWKARLQRYAPHADVEVLTFQAATTRLQHNELQGTFLLVDEGHRLPAATWSRLAFAPYIYRVLMTATPWRLKRPSMIFALGGPPFRISWNALIQDGVLNRPRVRVVSVPNKEFKLRWIKRTLAAYPGVNTLIYCDDLTYGKELSAALGVPFIYGETRDKYRKLMESEVRIVSKALEASISLEALGLVIEADISRTGSSRISAGQRVGRMLHSRTGGDYYSLFTPRDFARFRSRLFGIEQELGDAIEYMEGTEHGGEKRSGSAVRSQSSASKQSRTVQPATAAGPTVPPKPAKPVDEKKRILSSRHVRLAIEQAYGNATSRTVKTDRPLNMLLETVWDKPLTLQEIKRIKEVGKGHPVTPRTLSTYQSALATAEQANLVLKEGDRWRTNRNFLESLAALDGA